MEPNSTPYADLPASAVPCVCLRARAGGRGRYAVLTGSPDSAIDPKPAFVLRQSRGVYSPD